MTLMQDRENQETAALTNLQRQDPYPGRLARNRPTWRGCWPSGQPPGRCRGPMEGARSVCQRPSIQFTHCV